ncbi:paraquat-inducible protein A [Vibrio fortis]|uniref:Paraquat-inducible protein A n=1 Tax=Vibrio fortis TaxID=212667 RepID=A0A5N3R6Q9_9VIBR|nr:paraquat-inducible protein A [Vibrio fortis]KAB0290003.1 paraquat-inducible protein A [Vibrio fortis]
MPERFAKSCHECGLVSQFEDLPAGSEASCPRCAHTLSSVGHHKQQGVIAYALASLITLIMSLTFPYMSFSVQGISQQITLYQAVDMMNRMDNSLIALLLFLAVILLPAYFLVLSLWFCVLVERNKRINYASHRFTFLALKSLSWAKPWLMVDVFLIGVLVSLIKIAALADVSMGLSFWAFCIYAMLVVKTISLVDFDWLWDRLVPNKVPQEPMVGSVFQNKQHLACHICGQVHHYSDNLHHCTRCNTHLHRFEPVKNLQIAWALLFTSIVFYIPANLYPMMYTSVFGTSEGSTIMEGVILLWHMGSYPVALIILIASVFIPMAKMVALAYLYWNAKRVHGLTEHKAKRYLKVYRVTEFIGRWSMIDIFVVAILVALVQLDGVMAIYPGPAALSFAAVVIFTMLSAMIFDSRIIWK